MSEVIMDDDFYWEIYEMFEEQLESQLPESELLLEQLRHKKTLANALEELFRFYHTYKATSAYLSLTPMNKLVKRVEVVLGSLREANMVVQDSIVDWLYEVTQQMFLYCDQMGLKKKILPEAPKRLFLKLDIKKPLIDPQEKLKKLSLLYIDEASRNSQKIIKYLSEYLNEVHHSQVMNLQEDIENLNHYDIVIVNVGTHNHKVIKLLKGYNKNIPIVSIFNKISDACNEKLLKSGVSHNIEIPLYGEKIERELLSIVKTVYSGSHLIIDHKKISHFISNLKPLSNTVFKIIDMCDDDEVPIKELMKVVKTDPIISAKILRMANSPIYGSAEIKTIDQAVAKFGKMLTKTFSLGTTHGSLGALDLSAYNITEDDFSSAAMIRASLMIKWYSKVSIADLSILSSVSFLNTIGQLLISKEILALGKEDDFQDLYKEFSLQYAEEAILNTNNNNVSSQILRYWKLSSDIVSIIEHTDYPAGAPKDLEKLCAANNIINSLVDKKGNITADIPQETLKMLKKYDFDEQPLLKAMEYFKSK